MEEGTSLLMESSENGTDLSQDDIGTIEETPEDTILTRQTSINLIPFIGQRFISQEAAYEFYCSFAKQFGFSIRRHRTRGKDGVGRGVTRRDFICHRGGYPQMKLSEDGKMQRNRKSSRCGCQAYLRIVRKADFDVLEWRITGFSNIHNHELFKSNEVNHLYPANCTISPDDKSQICMFAKAGMSVRQMIRLMELEKGLKLGCLPFTEMDVRNLIQSFRNVDKDNDAIDLVSMCKKMKDGNPNFKYEFKIDGYNRLECIAWSYASSVQAYEVFGDAVIFDTTHRIEAYDMLLGIWLGVDNHGMTCFFSCVLLRDDNLQSFSWALKTFLSFMNGKAPQTISTDHNMWLKEAIAIEVPETKHAFCIWHIVSKFSDWFSFPLGSRYDDWKAEFNRIYDLESVDEFEEAWRDMVDTYQLHSNRHIVSLYALRTFWALAFLRNYFFAEMMSACQSESINSFIQRFLMAECQIDCFVGQLADIVDFNDRVGSKQKMQRKQQKIFLKTGSPIESHAASILTPYAFNKLQEELALAPQYASLLMDESCFQVRHHTQMDGGFRVIWVPCHERISCSCRLFEFSRILCRHVLRVLSTNNCFNIPDPYLPSRWRNNTCSSSPSSSRPFPNSNPRGGHSEKIHLLRSMVNALVTESVETEERLDVACEQISMALSRLKDLPRAYNNKNCSLDLLMLPDVEDDDSNVVHLGVGSQNESMVTLGKLKERRMRDGVDTISRKRKSYSGSYCGGPFGHDGSDCPIMDSGDNLGGDGLGYL